MPMFSFPKIRCAALLCLLWAALAAGCGIKGPPVAPERTPPEPATDLQAVVEGETIRLHWTVQKSALSGASALEGFTIFRWRKPLEQPACPGCPKVFERIGDVDAAGGAPLEKDRLRFSLELPLPAGYRYAFKVIGFGQDGLRSDDSNVLNFDY
jgi:hypothetical protein